MKMMEVENRIETFGGQVDELPDDLKDRRINGNHLANGNGVILEESEDEDQGEAAGILEKAPAEAVGGRVIKKVGPACLGQQTVACAATLQTLVAVFYNWNNLRPRDQPRQAPSLSLELLSASMESAGLPRT